MIKEDTSASDTGDESEQPVPVVSIVDEISSAYRDYAMSVIVSRALPDVRDGLKPVHRRILFAMNDAGNTHGKPYRKSARPVGEVMGKYHPHGDAAIYDALVRMAQDFTMSLPLLDGQGNFGSLDGDNAAAMRYTEVRLAETAAFMLADIGADTVDFQENYDGKDTEPTVLPSRFPNILVNGAAGIAVGMATTIPPHNLGEAIDATLALIEDPDVSIDALLELMPGPDFPTGGIILGNNGIRASYLKGSGRIVIRARTTIETTAGGRQSIVIEEIPYQVIKSDLVQQIAEAARAKIIEGIESVQDESDRQGVRVVIGLKRHANEQIVLNQLWKRTRMQTTLFSNMVALDRGQPDVMNLMQILSAFVEFREEVVARRTAHQLRQARERSHILCGLVVAVKCLDEVIAMIRSSQTPAIAREALKSRVWPAADVAPYIRLIDDPVHTLEADDTYRLSDRQARAILDLRMQRLTALGIDEIANELSKLASRIKDCLAVLRSRQRILGIISNELREVRQKFAVPRRTAIVEDDSELLDEDLIERREMVIIVTRSGYVKRMSVDELRQQRRGGRGLIGTYTAEGDLVTAVHVANTHDELLCFAEDGIVYKTKTWQFPEAKRYSRGRPLASILSIQSGISISEITPISPDAYDDRSKYLLFSASNGMVRRSRLSLFRSVMASGKIAITIAEGASLVNVRLCTTDDDVLVATRSGKVNRFPVELARSIKSRVSAGVKGITLADNDEVIALEIVRNFGITADELQGYLSLRRLEHKHAQEAASDVVIHSSQGEPGEMAASWEPDAASLAAAGGTTRQRWSELRATEKLLLAIDKNGLGKLTSSHEFPVRRGRTGQGLKAIKSGGLVAFMTVSTKDQIVLATDGGQLIRCKALDVSYQSRYAGGVRLMRLTDDERIVSVARIDADTLVINGEP